MMLTPTPTRSASRRKSAVGIVELAVEDSQRVRGGVLACIVLAQRQGLTKVDWALISSLSAKSIETALGQLAARSAAAPQASSVPVQLPNRPAYTWSPGAAARNRKYVSAEQVDQAGQQSVVLMHS